MKNLFIVESPGKIKQISKYLGNQYIVAASMGHFRDLNSKTMSINFNSNFKPIYVITKKDVVKKLKSLMKQVDTVYLAPDLDREGESIAEHLYQVLKPTKYKRLVFNSITKDAILKAIQNAGSINNNLVDAQKARRIIDRIYGYTISPLLQSELGSNLSAGRVQSVALKIIIDREDEINNFLDLNDNCSHFRICGNFENNLSRLMMAKNKNLNPYKGSPYFIPNSELVNSFLTKCLKSNFVVYSVRSTVSTKKPPPPFETYSLQQESNQKLGLDVDTTMKLAQKLYENGYITYMRTDSIEICQNAHDDIKKVICQKYGDQYYCRNKFKNKSSNSQEAHEAIRPIDPSQIIIDTQDLMQNKLYQLIWKRTIASCMKPAKINIGTIEINISQYLKKKSKDLLYFESCTETVSFDGYTKVYKECDDDKKISLQDKLPKVGQQLNMNHISATQEYLSPKPRYTQSSLIGKLKKLDIGRPSTYANIISTIINRKYIKIGNVIGNKKTIYKYSIEKGKNKIIQKCEDTIVGKENNKIIPTQLGINVNQYLIKNIPDMLDYKFTAKMENELDKISKGEIVWHHVVKKYYDKLNTIIPKKVNSNFICQKIITNKKRKIKVIINKGKYGPYLRVLDNEKPTNYSIPKNIDPYKITNKNIIEIISQNNKSGSKSQKKK